MFFVDKTIAVSDSIKNQVKNWPFIKNKVFVIKLGLERFEMLEKNEARKVLNIPDDKGPIIGTIAELHPIKGLSYAIDAIKILKEKYPNIFYAICGEGEERESLESKIKSLKLEDNVILKGNVYEAKKYLKAFDMFLLPSVSEALSYALLEAGFAELPVVATNVGGIPEIIIGSDVSLVEPRNALKMAQNIDTLLKDELLRKKSIANIKQNITQNFSFHQSIQKTIDLYDRIIMS